MYANNFVLCYWDKLRFETKSRLTPYAINCKNAVPESTIMFSETEGKYDKVKAIGHFGWWASAGPISEYRTWRQDNGPQGELSVLWIIVTVGYRYCGLSLLRVYTRLVFSHIARGHFANWFSESTQSKTFSQP